MRELLSVLNAGNHQVWYHHAAWYGVMGKKSNRLSSEVRERAVRRVQDHRSEYPLVFHFYVRLVKKDLFEHVRVVLDRCHDMGDGLSHFSFTPDHHLSGQYHPLHSVTRVCDLAHPSKFQ